MSEKRIIEMGKKILETAQKPASYDVSPKQIKPLLQFLEQLAEDTAKDLPAEQKKEFIKNKILHEAELLKAGAEIGEDGKPIITDQMIQETIARVQAEARWELARLVQEHSAEVISAIRKAGSAEGLTSPERAQEVMKEDFFGPQAVEKTWGVELKDIPPITFSEAELERTKELGQMLILRIDKASDGQPLTMKKMHELLAKRLKTEGKGKILSEEDDNGKIRDDYMFKDEPFFTQETPQLDWALISKEIISRYTSSNYLKQTEELVNYLKEQVRQGEPLSDIEEKAIEEFESQKDEMRKIMYIQIEQKAVVKWLSELSINQLFRRTPAEVMYDSLLILDNSGKRVLENVYEFTNRLTSQGYFVGVGPFGSAAADVRSYGLGHSDSFIRSTFSRRAP